jgi:crotonobetainyl-CoA:carnitine CoA-transferase CaiB-like acyl-CoA transferase
VSKEHAKTRFDKPLNGLGVLDLSGGVSGPFCSQLLLWLGARVTRVTGPEADLLESLGTGADSMGRALNDYVNAAKETLAVATGAEFEEVVLDQLPAADIVVTDWSAGRWPRGSLSQASLAERFPRLVVVSVTPYGLTGPHAERPGTEATSYHAGSEGYLLPGGEIFEHFPDRPPVRGGRFLADYDAGLTAATGALAALVHRSVSGQGDLVEVSAQEVEIGLNRTTVSRALHEGVDYDRSYPGYDYAGVLRCLDGYICLRPSEESHWTSFCRVIGRMDLVEDPRFATRTARFAHGPELTAELERWTTTVDRAEVRKAINEAGTPGGPYLRPSEVLVDPAITSRGLIGPHPEGGSAPRGVFHTLADERDADPGALYGRLEQGLHTGSGPLVGLRVLDLTWVAAGPYTTELLAFMGAEVIRVESRTRPDLFRRGLDDPSDLDGSIRFIDLNQGKKSIGLELKDPAQVEAFLDLVEQSDVVVDNYRPGVRDRLGLGDAALRRRNPAVAIVSLSGFGATATDADRPGYASIFSAESGLSAMTGYPDAPPADIRDTNDLRTGTVGCLGVLAGLFTALEHRRGLSVDAAARDVLIALQGDALLEASRGGAPQRSGNTLDNCVPYDCYRSVDGQWVAIGARTPAEWLGLVDAIDQIALRSPQFRDAKARVASRSAIDSAVATWCSSQSAAAIVEQLSTHGVPAARSTPIGALRDDPHLVARQFFVPGSHPRFGDILFVGSPLRFAGTEPPTRAVRSPLFAEHDAEFLADVPSLNHPARTVDPEHPMVAGQSKAHAPGG